MNEYIGPLIGGGCIGLAATLLMVSQGRVMGVSGITSALLPPRAAAAGDWDWRLLFLLGMLAAPLIVLGLSGYRPPAVVTDNSALLIIAGLLVGMGTVIGNGCTSGHGVCGMARLSRRSLAATAIFMLTAMVTVYVTRHVLGWV